MPEMIDGFLRGAGAEIGPRIEAMLARGETVTLQVSGDSMRPTLKPRQDAAVLVPVGDEPVARGEILFFRTGRAAGGYSLHRAVKVTRAGLVMNGDAQGWTEWISRDDVLARAVAVERDGNLVDLTDEKSRNFFRYWRYTRLFRKPMFAVWRLIKRLSGKK